MDCNMPIMNGIEATQCLVEMMRNSQVKTVPIVANTAFTEGEFVAQCLRAGMSFYSTVASFTPGIVEKPLSNKKVRELLILCKILVRAQRLNQCA